MSGFLTPPPSIPKDYGYVILTVTGTFFLGFWHAYRIPTFRKTSGMRYPKAYADSGDMAAAETPEKKHAMYLFNCAQRAHGNFMESHMQVTIAMLISGLRYPIATAAMGVAWSFFRIVYAVGYTRSDKSDGTGRLWGTPHSFIQLGLYLTMAWTGLQMVM